MSDLVSAIARLQEIERAAERRDGAGLPGGRVRREELRLVKSSYEQRLERLRREAFLLDVALASTDVLEPELLRLVASELTGGSDGTPQEARGGAWSAPLVPLEEPLSGEAQEHAWRRLDLDPEAGAGRPGMDIEANLVRMADAKEVVAAGFRFPVSFSSTDTTVPVRVARLRPLPRQLACLAEALVAETPVGVNRYLGESREVVLPESERRQHCYIVGSSGVGKSTLLSSMILGDMAAGRGVAVLDPHGDLFEDLLQRIPEDRWDDVVLLDPTDTSFPVGLNPLECAW